MNIASINPEFVFCDYFFPSFLAQLVKPVPFLLGAHYVTLKWSSTLYICVKQGHSLGSTCSHLVPNLVTKNTGNRRSWDLDF